MPDSSCLMVAALFFSAQLKCVVELGKAFVAHGYFCG